MMSMTVRVAPFAVLIALAACGADSDHSSAERVAASFAVDGETFRIEQAHRTSYLAVSGVAEAVQEATLSTRLMGSVTAVLVQEGDRVAPGQVLIRLDARELAAKADQIEASYTAAATVHREAELYVQRIRALFEDDAAPRAQLDAAEAGLERAVAGLAAVRGNAAELGALQSYATIRAPFSGVIVQRMVDPGAFAAPGAPLLSLQDVSRLRITGSVPAHAIAILQRGSELTGTVEGEAVTAIVEGVVPAGSGSMYRVNALVDNSTGQLPAGGSASLAVPLAERSMIVIPATALIRQGDLTGVHVRRDENTVLRWIRVTPLVSDSVEVLAGLQAGDEIIVPAARVRR